MGIVHCSYTRIRLKLLFNKTCLFIIFTVAIKEKFGEAHFNKKWMMIRQSLNQKCLDSKRKLSKIEEKEEGENRWE